MKARNKKIVVECNPEQKETFIISGIEIRVPILFETNYREKSPVICQVIEGNDDVEHGNILICHHNTFYHPSPYYLYDNLFSIPANGKIIFCKLNIHDGSLLPILGNMLCDKVDIETEIPLPPSERKQHTDRIIVTDAGYTCYKNGDMLFTRPSAAYDIVYNWNGDIKRITKCYDEQVCGINFIPSPQ